MVNRMNTSFPNRWPFSYLKFTKYVTNIIAEPRAYQTELPASIIAFTGSDFHRFSSDWSDSRKVYCYFEVSRGPLMSDAGHQQYFITTSIIISNLNQNIAIA